MRAGPTRRPCSGDIALQDHDVAEAERCFRRAADREPKEAEPLKRLVSILVLEHRTAEVRSALRRLFQVTRDPRYLADSILISQAESEVRRPESGDRDSTCARPRMTLGCGAFGGCTCFPAGEPRRPSRTSRPRPRPSMTTPWAGSPLPNADGRRPLRG